MVQNRVESVVLQGLVQQVKAVAESAPARGNP
jgi:hypothetical protein